MNTFFGYREKSNVDLSEYVTESELKQTALGNIDLSGYQTKAIASAEHGKIRSEIVAGTKGDKGNTGPQGAKGDKGDVGSQGAKGDKGNTGSQGTKGDKGDVGSQGTKGDKGNTGSQGTKGDKGDVGSQGTKGDKGNTGSQGPKGVKGDKGSLSSTVEFLKKTDAAAVYETKADAGATFETIQGAQVTFLTKSHARSTFMTKNLGATTSDVDDLRSESKHPILLFEGQGSTTFTVQPDIYRYESIRAVSDTSELIVDTSGWDNNKLTQNLGKIPLALDATYSKITIGDSGSSVVKIYGQPKELLYSNEFSMATDRLGSENSLSLESVGGNNMTPIQSIHTHVIFPGRSLSAGGDSVVWQGDPYAFESILLRTLGSGGTTLDWTTFNPKLKIAAKAGGVVAKKVAKGIEISNNGSKPTEIELRGRYKPATADSPLHIEYHKGTSTNSISSPLLKSLLERMELEKHLVLALVGRLSFSGRGKNRYFPIINGNRFEKFIWGSLNRVEPTITGDVLKFPSTSCLLADSTAMMTTPVTVVCNVTINNILATGFHCIVGCDNGGWDKVVGITQSASSPLQWLVGGVSSKNYDTADVVPPAEMTDAIVSVCWGKGVGELRVNGNARINFTPDSSTMGSSSIVVGATGRSGSGTSPNLELKSLYVYKGRFLGDELIPLEKRARELY